MLALAHRAVNLLQFLIFERLVWLSGFQVLESPYEGEDAEGCYGRNREEERLSSSVEAQVTWIVVSKFQSTIAEKDKNAGCLNGTD